jgi:purine catabolism regulator
MYALLESRLEPGFRCGLSQPGHLPDIALCLNQATAAADISGGSGRMEKFVDIAILNLALNTHNRDLELLTHRLAPLTAYDAENPGEVGLVATLCAFLRESGYVERAAADLAIHRHTMRNRLAKIGELTGLNLDNADIRTELWLAMRARELLEIRRGAKS